MQNKISKIILTAIFLFVLTAQGVLADYDNKGSEGEYEINSAVVSWNLADNLYPNQSLTTPSFTVNKTTNVTVTVVQWRVDNSSSEPEIMYRLVGNYITHQQPIKGRFTHSNTSVTFTVPAGTYHLEITNLNNYTVGGNGYVTLQ